MTHTMDKPIRTAPVPRYSPDIKSYYGRRASEYDRIYLRPDRQPALRELESWVSGTLSGQRVLEVACGTGYWTRLLAAAACHVVAVDINPEMIRIARDRCQTCAGVEFRIEDAYDHLAAGQAFLDANEFEEAVDCFLDALKAVNGIT